MLTRAGSIKWRTLEVPDLLLFLTRPSDGQPHVDRPFVCLGLGSLTPSSKASRHRSPWSMSRVALWTEVAQANSTWQGWARWMECGDTECPRQVWVLKAPQRRPWRPSPNPRIFQRDKISKSSSSESKNLSSLSTSEESRDRFRTSWQARWEGCCSTSSNIGRAPPSRDSFLTC